MDDAMPEFAEAFGYTPTEFRALSFADYRRLMRHLAENPPKRGLL